MSIKAYKVETDDEEGKGWYTIGYATGLESDIKKHFDDSKTYRLRLEPIDIVNLNKENHDMTSKKKSQYQVFYKRDLDFEKRKNYGEKMLFDESRKFNDEEKAYEFAHNNIPALIIEKTSKQTKYSNDIDYIVAAKFVGKYRHYDYGGGSDALTNYDILRCKRNELENIIEEFAKEGAEEIIMGVEKKLF